MKGRIPANPASVTNAGRVGKCLRVVNRVSVILIPARNPYREGETEEPTLFSLKPKGRDGQGTKIQREKSFDASEEEE